jgi:hypothetical protein
MFIFSWSGTSDFGAVAMGVGMHQLAANRAANRQVPAQAKY